MYALKHKKKFYYIREDDELKFLPSGMPFPLETYKTKEEALNALRRLLRWLVGDISIVDTTTNHEEVYHNGKKVMLQSSPTTRKKNSPITSFNLLPIV